MILNINKKTSPSSYFRAPNLLALFCGTVVSMVNSFRKQKCIRMPHRIKGFTLIKEIKREDGAINVAMALYNFAGKKFVVKRWEGGMQDLRYYGLMNEYRVGVILNRVQRRIATDSAIKFPRVRKLLRDKNSLSVIFEFVDGDTLNQFDLNRQSEILEKILVFFRELSRNLTPRERLLLGSRHGWHYALFLPGIMLLSAMFSPKDWKIIFRTGARALKVYFYGTSNLVGIAHRDMTPTNIIVNGQFIYVLDNENLILTLSGYDLAYLSVTPGCQKVASLVRDDVTCLNGSFLENYIILHHILGSGSFFSVNREYIQMLYDRT